MNNKIKYWAGLAGACLLLASSGAQAQSAASSYKPTVEDWAGVNTAVGNYTLGLELHDPARFDKAFWPEATITAKPEPGMTFTRPYRESLEPPKPPPGAPPMTNAIGNGNPPWHLSLSHHFEFQSAKRATHYGYFISVYPDLKTKTTIVGLPGHYEDVLENRNGEWRIAQRTTVIGAK